MLGAYDDLLRRHGKPDMHLLSERDDGRNRGMHRLIER